MQTMKTDTTSDLGRSILAVLAVTAALLMIPALAMQFTQEVDWGPGDFVLAGLLIAGTGLTFVLGRRAIRGTRQRVIFGTVLALGFLLIWAELAVGLFD